MEHFEILSKLGEGSYSEVLKVKRKDDSKVYALKKVKLKKLSEKEKNNALNEVRILASIKNTNVISYKEAFIDEKESTLCIVMEYADRGDLFQKITKYKKRGLLFDECDIWKIFIQMTKGLKALHDLNILHRDLKSANIFLFCDDTAKIGDLNVSKVAKKGLGYTQTGTPYYASPEVWNDEPYDSKSDIWSLGCVTYEMLTLHPPFRAENMKGLYEKVMKGKYPKINDKYSKDINELLKLLFKLNPKERPSCDEILKIPEVVKRIEFFDSGKVNDNTIDESSLLKTIRVPKNLIFLLDKLPKANYDIVTEPSLSTVETSNVSRKIKSQNKLVLPLINNLKSMQIDNDLTQKNCIKNLKTEQNNINIIQSPSKKSENENIMPLYDGSKNKPIKLISPDIYIKEKKYKGKKNLNELYRLYVLKNNNNNNKMIGKKGNMIRLYLPKVFIRKSGRNNSNVEICQNYLSPRNELKPIKFY